MREHRSGLRWSFAIVTFLTILLVVLPFATGGGAPRLRDRHGNPGAEEIPATVAVARAGKLYHDPRCAFIHGRAILLPATEAIARGFSPCPRCLGNLKGLGARGTRP